MPSTRRAATLVAACALLTAACGASPAGTVSHMTIAPATSSTAQRPATAPPASPSPTGSPVAGAPVVTRTLPAIAGYTYLDPPKVFADQVATLGDSGLTSSISAKSVRDASGRTVAIVVLAQYNAKLARRLDAQPLAKVLDGAATGGKAYSKSHVTVTDKVVAGRHARTLSSRDLHMVVAYLPGGTLVEVISPTTASAESFAARLLGAL